MQNLARLGDDLRLFLRRAVGEERVDLRDAIERDAMREDRVAALLGAAQVEEVDRLARQRLDAALAAARNRLVARRDDASEADGVGDRLQRDDDRDRRAVRARDDATLARREVVRIHLGHDERDVRLLAEVAALVDDDGTRVDGDRRVLGAHRAAGAEEREIDAAEALGVEQLDAHLAALELDQLAGGTLGGEEAQLADREPPLLKDLQELAADGAGGADDGDVVLALRHPPILSRRRRRRDRRLATSSSPSAPPPSISASSRGRSRSRGRRARPPPSRRGGRASSDRRRSRPSG